MIKSTLSILLLLTFNITLAQSDKIDQVLKSKVLLTNHVDITKLKNKTFLHTDFATAQITNQSEINTIEGKRLKAVDLVYTTYRSVPTFKQLELNKKRLLELNYLLPGLLYNTTVQWSLIGQTSCKSSIHGKSFFHGFILSYYADDEMEKLNKGVLESSYIVPAPRDKYGLDRIPFLASSKSSMKDSTVFSVFSRNPQWSKMAIVCDFTSSMHPYTRQLLIWHKLNFEKNKARIASYTFFNDGDRKPDVSKKVGSTGGLYYAVANNFEDIKNLAIEVIKNGSGGDGSENNIEAVLHAIDTCDECEDIIMIADNPATPRDTSLLNQVTKPIKVIVCGSSGWINPVYLDIARLTKGSIHTIEYDLYNLMNLSEGESITIDKRTYQLENGRFVALHKM